jgi:Spy/CpxP family protein refolding chaperone
MKKRYINALSLIISVLAVAFAAMFFGQHYISMPHDFARHSGDTHSYLHEQLNITQEQDIKLQDSESDYQKRKLRLQETIRLANMELADAIHENPSFTPAVQQAVDKIHNAMGQLQKASLDHLFQMQPILTDDQNKKLKKLITEALYDNAKGGH